MENNNHLKTETDLRLWQDVINHDDCDRLINLCRPAVINTMAGVGGNNYHTIRKADSIWLDEEWLKPNDAKLVSNIRETISELSEKPISMLERLHIIRYNEGDYFLPHYDFFSQKNEYSDIVHAISDSDDMSEQRTESWMLYLNDDFTGGETFFQRENIIIDARKGGIVSWKNICKDGSLNFDSLHSGEKINSGEKWIAITWIRNKNYNKKKEDTDKFKRVFENIGYFNL
jgi:prolyl 4-hydroxylase